MWGAVALAAATVVGIALAATHKDAPARTPEDVARIIQRQFNGMVTDPANVHYMPGQQVRVVQCEGPSPGQLDCVAELQDGVSYSITATVAKDGSFVWHTTP